MYPQPAHEHWPASFAFPEVDPSAFFEEEGYPWAYPTDAGFASSWPEADVVENPFGDLFWPTLYDPHVAQQTHVAEHMHFGPRHHDHPSHVAGATLPQTPADWLRAGGVTLPSQQWLQKTYGTLQDTGQRIAQAAQQGAPSFTPSGVLQQTGIPDALSKTSAAADAVQRQTNALSDEGKRTMALAQASMADANRHIEDTAKHAQATSETIKYVVLGVGALTAVALIFNIVKQASE